MAKANIKVTFLCPVKKVWDTVTDLSRCGWRSDLERIEIIGDGRFVEVTKGGIRTTFTVTEKRNTDCGSLIWKMKI